MSLLKKVDRYLLDRARGNTRRSKTMTGSIASVCARWLYYEVMRYPPNKYRVPNLDLQYIFRDGNVGQEVFVELCKEAGILILREEFYVRWRDIPSRVDFRADVDGQLYDVEFKRFSPNMFQLWSQGGVRAFPRYHAQTQVISASVHNPVLFIVQNKGLGIPGEEMVERDPEALEQIYQSKLEFERAKRTNVAPKRPFEFGSAECYGCEFKTTCWFSAIVKEKVESLTEEEKERVLWLVDRLKENKESWEKYSGWWDTLGNYLAILHARYSSKRLEIGPVRSQVIFQKRKHLDQDRMRNEIPDLAKYEYEDKNSFIRKSVEF